MRPFKGLLYPVASLVCWHLLKTFEAQAGYHALMLSRSTHQDAKRVFAGALHSTCLRTRVPLPLSEYGQGDGTPGLRFRGHWVNLSYNRPHRVLFTASGDVRRTRLESTAGQTMARRHSTTGVLSGLEDDADHPTCWSQPLDPQASIACPAAWQGYPMRAGSPLLDPSSDSQLN